MTETALAPIRRILLALDASEETSMIDKAAALAARLDAELEALFVEDEALLRFAALPFAGEVGFASARRRPLHDQDIERMLQARAARSRAALVAYAGRTPVRWTFRVARGELTTQVTAAAVEADFVTLVIGAGAMSWMHIRVAIQQIIGTALRPLLILPAGADLRAPYVVVFDGSEAAARALQFAARLGGCDPGSLCVLLAAPQGEAARRRSDAEGVLANCGAGGSFRLLPDTTAAEISRIARREDAGTVLLPVHEGLRNRELIVRRLGDDGCAVLLVP